jgi:hypothetical protein
MRGKPQLDALSAEESLMSSMARMAVFVVLGSAFTVGALMVASYLAGVG